MKIKHAIISTFFFLALLITIYIAHIKFLNVNVIFYASIADMLITAAIMGLILFTPSLFQSLTKFEKSQLIIIWLSIGYSLVISIPTVIDRSLSFYLLEKLQQRDGGIKLSAFEDVFSKEYIKEYHLIDVRITEQIESGTIVLDRGCVKLTPKGETIAEFSSSFRRNLLPKKRLLMGNYSDDLTHPLKNDTYETSYKCK